MSESLEKSASALAEALKRCESEPIAHIGTVQDHGLLLALDDSGHICAASNNLHRLFGLSAEQALQKSAQEVLGPQACQGIAALGELTQDRPPLAVKLQLRGVAQPQQARVHRSGPLLIIEIEELDAAAGQVGGLDADAQDQLLTALLADHDSIEDYAAVITKQIRQCTGYDRVMVYRFDPAWNGQVIAESCRADLPTLLGHHFPASDIPPPARALYTRNLVRVLVNRSAQPAALLLAPDTPLQTLDLSFAVLRSMSPVHLQYLSNLNVHASLTVSLLQNGKLWGLIACHHATPRQLAFQLRMSMELIARAIAMRLSAMSHEEDIRYQMRLRALLPKLTGPSGLTGQRGQAGLLPADLQQEVLDLVQASGVVMTAGRALNQIGLTPEPTDLHALLDWLRPQLVRQRTYCTHHLSAAYPPGARFGTQAAGLLAISLDLDAQQCLLWFRQEVIQTTTWAGQAEKHLVRDAFGPKLEPRRSFASWVQTRRGESRHWSRAETEMAQTISLTLTEMFARQQLQASEESRRLAASVYEHSSEAMLVTDANNTILHINPAFTASTGYSAQDVLGRSPQMLQSGRHDHHFYQQMWQALSTQGSWSGEIWNRRKNGEIYPEWLTINNVRDADGQVHRRVALFTDITERKQAEAALHASEARFRSVFERAYLGISITNLDGDILEANESLAKIVGYSRSELVGMNVARFTHPQDQLAEAERIADLTAGRGDSFRLQKRYLTRAGVVVWIDLLVTVLRDADQRLTALIRLVIDITDRIRAEGDLRIAATAFESQEGMTVTDAHGVVLRVNQAFTQITGYRADEVIGQTLRLLHSGQQDAWFYRRMWTSVRHTGSWQGDLWNRRKNGEAFFCWLSITAVKGSTGQVSHYVGTFTDLTERKEAADKIEHLAFYDHLTHLPNRRLMLDRLGQSLVNAQRRQRQGALLLIDLDNFKYLNDTRGHAAGDLLLIEVAKRLQASVRAGDSIARMGGDEFIVILQDLGDDHDAIVHAESLGHKIMAQLGQVYQLTPGPESDIPSSFSHFCTCSIGVCLFDGASVNANELIQHADTALYQAKAAGRNSLRFFDPDMQASVQARAAMEVDLRQALRIGQLLLYYQVQVDASGHAVGAETLVRWQHPERGMVSPGDFISLAEETGLILPLGQWVLDRACQQLASWANERHCEHLTLSVNVSAKQFALADFVERVLAAADLAGARLDRLKLELTESLLLDNTDQVVAKMLQLKTLGVSFSLDDFGTGFSSLSYLKRLPLDQLKIDQSFVRDIVRNPHDAAIAKTIVALGHNLGMTVIAEGVETLAQRNVLAQLGCLQYQGFFFGRPMPISEFTSRQESGLITSAATSLP